MNIAKDLIVYWIFVGILITPSNLKKNKNKANNWWNLANVDFLTSSSPAEQIHLPPHVLSLTKKQHKIINKNPGSMGVVIKAAKLAVDECGKQFGGRKWNCSVSTSYHSGYVFGAIVKKGCRETAFLHALTSAALTFSIARACSEGTILTCTCGSKFPRKHVSEASKKQNCGLPPIVSNPIKETKTTKKHQKMESKKIKQHAQRNLLNGVDDEHIVLSQIPQTDHDVECQWGGCSDNNEFGIKFSREFIDGSEKDNDLRCAMNLHNNEAGRQHVNRLLQMDCKCHGMSGSCSIKTCWMKISSFAQVASLIREKYDSAHKVDQGNDIKGKTRFKFKPAKNELVYFEDSPNFCEPDLSLNFIGVKDRICNVSSKEDDGCENICCGRGYKTEKFEVYEKCNCSFHWCCEVRCDKCKVKKEKHTCL